MLLETDDFLTAEQAAIIVGCSVRTLQRRSADGRAPRPFRLGGRARYSEREIRAWIAGDVSRGSWTWRDVEP